MLRILLFVMLCGSFLLGGCSINIRAGHRPDVDLLEKKLRLKESTSADVILALGQPFGKGRLMFPIDPKPRTLWSYYYEEADMNDARRLFLFVFFDRDRYDGYMWVSSLSKTSPPGRPSPGSSP
ncbi:MAG: hypothetical protein ACM3TN_10950 [Alphaproteobacteria bacterium]